MTPETAPPAISVIMLTYNRSERRRSHRPRRSAPNRCCTDVVGALVAADRRIRFVDLPHNTGEQSATNNLGLKHARGRYIAFLNHDDLWLLDHLERSSAIIERRQADLIYSLPMTVAYDDGRVHFHPINGQFEYHPM